MDAVEKRRAMMASKLLLSVIILVVLVSVPGTYLTEAGDLSEVDARRKNYFAG
jgi:hypothetical protein